MKKRYRLICRNLRGGTYYCVDNQTGKRTSLGKVTAEEAREIVDAKNKAERQPMLNLQIAKACLSARGTPFDDENDKTPDLRSAPLARV